MKTETLDPFDEAVYDMARTICTEGAILGGSHAFDDTATFTTASAIRSRLADSRRDPAFADVRRDPAITAALVTAALRRLCDRKLVERVRLERHYKTARSRPVPYAGYVVVGEKP